MRSELRGLLSSAVMSVPTEGNRLIKEFVEKNSANLTPDDLVNITILGALIQEKQNFTHLEDGETATQVKQILSKIFENSGDS